ncbi:hypothetical protein [Mesorhizobium sp.]|uniref:hypothetical protein n=1 Tax=Mesorhizobium sp. TaxID=1871066 RepID=UPI000FE8AD0B|nr:hypothetical protein [Mesorhizobium sp.]RWK59444.1 MAG: hypothetical protein EOR49_26020 [Mesorhizobium sp.]RWM44623.1 MAG: hypothetical protein EOR76_23725 [Mesorhizobium sp.]RWM53617.1 MAG: hypothetical protein EOR79_25725 [Mesorhizobium sp.]RWM58006.1 MAG: hypothetical protein EOR78_08425 [Mesorhizobium sp.]RWM94947.1 MAG: hypothetical protein EOR85_24835 [Mesorhizobium sp.]
MFQITKLTESVPLIVSACLAAGLCWTVGSCFPLGTDAFYYLGATDFMRSALICVPLTLLCAPLLLMAVALHSNDRATEHTRKLVAEYEQRGRRAVYVVAAIREALYHLPLFVIFSVSFLGAPSKFEVEVFLGYYILAVFAGTMTFANLGNGQLRRLVELSIYLGALVLLSVLLQVHNLRSAEESPSESICLGETCRQGTVVARFSEASFIWWTGATAHSIIPNDQITAINKLGDSRVKPLWDLKATLRSWFTKP